MLTCTICITLSVKNNNLNIKINSIFNSQQGILKNYLKYQTNFRQGVMSRIKFIIF